jgi:hypothetical protein
MLLAVTTDGIRTVALVVIAVVAGGGLLTALVVRAVVAKVISLAVVAVVAGLVWNQRSAIDDCVTEVKQTAMAGAPATCSFFGFEVEIPVDELNPTS